MWFPRSMQKSWGEEENLMVQGLIRWMLLQKACQSRSVLLAIYTCLWSWSMHLTENWYTAWRWISPGFTFWIRHNAKGNTSIYTCVHTQACVVEQTVPTILSKYPRPFLQLQKLEDICYLLIFFNVSARINDTVTLTGITAWKLSVLPILPQHVTSQRKKFLRNYGAKVLFSPKHKPYSLQGNDQLRPNRERVTRSFAGSNN